MKCNECDMRKRSGCEACTVEQLDRIAEALEALAGERAASPEPEPEPAPVGAVTCKAVALRSVDCQGGMVVVDGDVEILSLPGCAKYVKTSPTSVSINTRNRKGTLLVVSPFAPIMGPPDHSPSPHLYVEGGTVVRLFWGKLENGTMAWEVESRMAPMSIVKETP